MTAGEWVGSLGVTILLVAFALNVLKRISADSLLYLLLNGTGALLACVSAVMVRFWPFVILEGVWALSSFLLIVRSRYRK